MIRNFDKVTGDEKTKSALATWFKNNQGINPVYFLEAQLTEGISDVEVITRRSSLKRYIRFMKELRSEPYTSQRQAQWATDSMKFIIDYCRESRLKIRDYVNHRPRGYRTNACVVHLKQSKVSMGVLLVMGGYHTLSTVYEDPEIRGFYLHGQDPYTESARVMKAVKFRDFVKKLTKYACLAVGEV
jgi:hypothetical protein